MLCAKRQVVERGLKLVPKQCSSVRFSDSGITPLMILKNLIQRVAIANERLWVLPPQPNHCFDWDVVQERHGMGKQLSKLGLLGCGLGISYRSCKNRFPGQIGQIARIVLSSIHLVRE